MRLLVVRHAIAEDVSPTGHDKDRVLTSRGQDVFDRFCKNLKHLNWKIDLLLNSPFIRAQQTADIFCKSFSVQKRQTSENLKPLSNPSDLLLEISSYNVDFVAVVGHQPFLAKFVNHCLIDAPENFIVIKRGGMAFLEFPLSVQSGSAILKALFSPKYFFPK